MCRGQRGIWIQLGFLLGILLGTGMGVLSHTWISTQNALLAATVSEIYSRADQISGTRYFLYVVRKRLPAILYVCGITFTGWYGMGFTIAAVIAGVWCGSSVLSATLTGGLLGLPRFVLRCIPHLPIYLFDCLLLFEFAQKRKQFSKKEQGKFTVQIVFFFFLGMLLEAWANPWLISFVS